MSVIHWGLVLLTETLTCTCSESHLFQYFGFPLFCFFPFGDLCQWRSTAVKRNKFHSAMSFPNKEERQKCWDSRDRYWECLDQSGDQNDKCLQLRALYEAACPSQWVSCHLII